jgi:hypothetical protein
MGMSGGGGPSGGGPSGPPGAPAGGFLNEDVSLHGGLGAMLYSPLRIEFTSRAVFGFHAQQVTKFADERDGLAIILDFEVYKHVLLKGTTFFSQLPDFTKQHPDFSGQCLAELIEILFLWVRNTRYQIVNVDLLLEH